MKLGSKGKPMEKWRLPRQQSICRVAWYHGNRHNFISRLPSQQSMKKDIDAIVPDTSIIIEGVLSKQLNRKELVPSVIIIHEAAIAELEHQANQSRTIGDMGLKELADLRRLCDQQHIELRFAGKRPTPAEIKYASMGEIDAMIRDLAFAEGATLMTADKTQANVARIKGIQVIEIQPEKKQKEIALEKFFDPMTMSVHLKENVIPTAKKGMPGQWDFVQLSDKKITFNDITSIAKEIIEESKSRRDSFIEVEREGSTIVQMGLFRIVICRPPFSDGWEITAVRPIKQLNLNDYNLTPKMNKRISEQAEGILVAGSPGMGKSTFAQAMAEYYASLGKIVKTIEAPRDLVLKDEITQYAMSHGDAAEVRDILLLSRPDYTLFDEMRNTEDFKLFADLRLAGIGLAGVVHATSPVDAIQRFVGRIELGVIPHVVDTVIFIKNGQVNKVLSLKMEVKVPSGMTEEDLARPIVVVRDFETNKPEFELYSYGEETVVVPVQEEKNKKEGSSGAFRLAAQQIEDYFYTFTNDVRVQVDSPTKATVSVPSRDVAKIIGKGGKHIEKIEKELGMKIDIKEL